MAEKLKETTKTLGADIQAKNWAGLKDILFEEIDLLRTGQIQVSRARVTSQLSKRIIEMATLEMYAALKIGDGSADGIKRIGNSSDS